jgi:hypothetical protein
MNIVSRTSDSRTGVAVCVVILYFGFVDISAALPRFALQSGVSCSNCHVNISGGGPRNEGGWWSMKEVGLFDPVPTFLKPVYNAESNYIIPEVLSWGFDLRQQIAKRGPVIQTDDGPDIERDFFSMQITPYLSYQPVEEVAVFAAYNFVEPVYSAQQHFYAGVTYKPYEILQLKAGYIQPFFGVRHDDHTTFTRLQGDIDFVPMYTELGAEVYVTPYDWLMVSGGAYSSRNRHDIVPQVSENGMLYTGNANIILPDYDAEIIFETGFSAASYDKQTLLGAHVGFGWLDKASLLIEYVNRQDGFWTDKWTEFEASADVFLAQLSIEVINGLAVVGRYEEAESEVEPHLRQIAKQWVAGLQIFVLPNVEFRPEYRFFDDHRYRVGQYTAQLHIFY